MVGSKEQCQFQSMGGCNSDCCFETHLACIEEMIKDLGAQFEKLDMNNCTHLVTTKGHVEYSRTQKGTEQKRKTASGKGKGANIAL